MRKAALAAGWEVERLTSWRVPVDFAEQDVVLYGEPLFAAVIAESLGVVLLEPAFDWLPTLPTQYRGREVRLTTLGEARLLKITRFVKPVDDKFFVAKVYDSGDQLPVETAPTDSTPVLISEPVHWEVEFRCFVLERQFAAISPYLRDGKLAQDEAGHWIDSRTAEALHFRAIVCPGRRD
jgi:ATP-grasp domain-containing protein